MGADSSLGSCGFHYCKLLQYGCPDSSQCHIYSKEIPRDGIYAAGRPQTQESLCCYSSVFFHGHKNHRSKSHRHQCVKFGKLTDKHYFLIIYVGNSIIFYILDLVQQDSALGCWTGLFRVYCCHLDSQRTRIGPDRNSKMEKKVETGMIMLGL